MPIEQDLATMFRLISVLTSMEPLTCLMVILTSTLGVEAVFLVEMIANLHNPIYPMILLTFLMTFLILFPLLILMRFRK